MSSNQYTRDMEALDRVMPSPDTAAILTEKSHDDFVRAAWIRLAKEDAPMDIFSCDFEEVRNVNHEILMESATATMNYTASIGHDRKESYTEYQVESQYINGKRYEKRVPVTKYRTVTDWSSLSGSYTGSDTTYVENGTTPFDRMLFRDAYSGLEQDPSADAAPAVRNEDAHASAMRSILRGVQYQLEFKLPGDHKKDVNVSLATISRAESAIYRAQEYTADIRYNGTTYTKRAFPFGNMVVGGDKIENPESLASAISAKKETIDPTVSKKTKLINLITPIVLGASIIASLAIRSFPIALILLLVGIGAFVATRVITKNILFKVTGEVNYECDNYAKIYRERQAEALNNKLRSLGYEPVDPSDFPGGAV